MLACAHPALDGPVILFQNIIEVLHRSMPAILLQSTRGFEPHDGWWITGVLVGVDEPRRRMVLSAQALARKRSAAAASRLADRRKSIVAPVESTARYKIHPFALDPDVGLVDAPTVVARSEPRAQTSFHFWGIPLDPTPHRDVIGVQTSLGEQLLDVPVRQGKTQIPTNRQKDDFRFELPPLEQTGNR